MTDLEIRIAGRYLRDQELRDARISDLKHLLEHLEGNPGAAESRVRYQRELRALQDLDCNHTWRQGNEKDRRCRTCGVVRNVDEIEKEERPSGWAGFLRRLVGRNQ